MSLPKFEWIDLGGGRSRYRRKRSPGESKRAAFPTPMVISDHFDAPVQSPADGKFYDTKSALRATYRPDGNPDGVKYTEVGEDTSAYTEWNRPKPDEAADRDAINRAFEDVQSGNVPHVLTTDEYPI